MIRTLTFRASLNGRDPEEASAAIEVEAAKLVRTHNTLRGVHTSWDSEAFMLSLRISGMDRWMIARTARKIASYLLATQRLFYTRPLNPVLEVTEPSARNLTLEQGRTVQSVKGGRGRRRRPVVSATGS